MTQTERETLTDLLNRIELHQDAIMVRAKKDGVWGNYALSELPAPLALQYACEWIRKTVYSMLTGSAERPAPEQTPGNSGQTATDRLFYCYSCHRPVDPKKHDQVCAVELTDEETRLAKYAFFCLECGRAIGEPSLAELLHAGEMIDWEDES